MELPEFAPGMVARVELTVTDADTAQALGSGDVPVLATPRVLALSLTLGLTPSPRSYRPSGQCPRSQRLDRRPGSGE